VTEILKITRVLYHQGFLLSNLALKNHFLLKKKYFLFEKNQNKVIKFISFEFFEDYSILIQLKDGEDKNYVYIRESVKNIQ